MSRSEKLIEATELAQEKFDYFMCGGIGAVLAYMANNYHSAKIDHPFDILEPVSILLVVAAFFFAIRRIEKLIQKQNAEAWLAQLREDYGPHFDYSSLGEKIKKPMRNVLEDFIPNAERAYTWRNRLLVLGLVCLFTSKLVAPYKPATVAPSSHQSPIPAAAVKPLSPLPRTPAPTQNSPTKATDPIRP